MTIFSLFVLLVSSVGINHLPALFMMLDPDFIRWFTTHVSWIKTFKFGVCWEKRRLQGGLFLETARSRFAAAFVRDPEPAS